MSIRFEIFTAAKIQTFVLFRVSPYCLVGGYQNFGGTNCYQLQGRSSLPQDGGTGFLWSIGTHLPDSNSDGAITWKIIFKIMNVFHYSP